MRIVNTVNTVYTRSVYPSIYSTIVCGLHFYSNNILIFHRSKLYYPWHNIVRITKSYCDAQGYSITIHYFTTICTSVLRYVYILNVFCCIETETFQRKMLWLQIDEGVACSGATVSTLPVTFFDYSWWRSSAAILKRLCIQCHRSTLL